MKILIVGRGYPSDRYPFNGIFEFDQAKALAKRGHKVIYAAVDARSIRRFRKWGYESCKKDGVSIEVFNIPVGRVPVGLLNGASIFAYRMLTKRISKKYGKLDLVHSHFLHSSYMVVKSNMHKDCPIIVTEHLSKVNTENIKPALFKMGQIAYTMADKVIAVSNALSKSIKYSFGIEPDVVPNIVDLSIFKLSDTAKQSNTVNFISVGNLINSKGMNDLINAFYDAFKGNKDVVLYIFGDGTQKNILQNIITDKKLDNQVFLMGKAKREVIAQKMRECHCFVLASKTETFGVAYIEALAMGLPVIATKCGGPEDFVDSSNGMLIEHSNIPLLAETLSDMKSNYNNFDEKVISNTVINKFSAEAISRRLTDLYANAIEDFNNK